MDPSLMGTVARYMLCGVWEYWFYPWEILRPKTPGWVAKCEKLALSGRRSCRWRLERTTTVRRLQTRLLQARSITERRRTSRGFGHFQRLEWVLTHVTRFWISFRCLPHDWRKVDLWHNSCCRLTARVKEGDVSRVSQSPNLLSRPSRPLHDDRIN